MLFLFFGIGTKLKLRGAAGERVCPRCHNTALWQRVERYSYLSLFFVRLFRWHREELDVCPVCGHGVLSQAAGRRGVTIGDARPVLR